MLGVRGLGICAAIAGIAMLVLPSASFGGASVQPRGAEIRSLTVDPGSVIAGESIGVAVRVKNPASTRSAARTLLVRLSGPGGNSILASRKIKRLGSGESKEFELSVEIPASTPPGAHTVIACRANEDDESRCGGRFREEAPLDVRELVAAALELAPAEHGFGTHATGTRSAAHRFTLTNTGGEPSGVPVAALAGSDPGQFDLEASTCDAALAPGQSCTLDVSFAPTSPGAKGAGLGVAASPGGTAASSLTGTGATPANLTIAPTAHGFGTHATGTTSGAQTFTVTNTGGVPSGTIATSLAGANPGQFEKSGDTCDGTTLAPGNSCTVGAAFKPTNLGAQAAALQATATPGGAVSASITGTGAAPADLAISGPPGDFGTQAIGTTSPPRTFTVTNTGGVPSGVIATGLNGTNLDQFEKSADGCAGQILGPGATCTIDVAFKPTSVGSKIAGLAVAADPGGNDGVLLSGTGQTPAQLEITPADHDFGNVHVDDERSQQFIVENIGEQTSGPVTVQGIAGSPFPFTTNCGGAELAQNETCEVNVSFTPNDPGNSTGQLTVSGSPGGSDIASLSGTGVATPANLQISITSFASDTPGTYSDSASRDLMSFPAGSSTSVKVWIRNEGQADAVVSNNPVPITSSNVTTSTPATHTCNVTAVQPTTTVEFTDTVIAGGSECFIAFRVSPTASGAWSTSFTVAGSPGGSITATVFGNAP